MSNANMVTGREILRELIPSERAIDNSILKNARLIVSIVEARQAMGLEPSAGHAAYMSAAKAQASLSEAKDLTLNCHLQLAELRDELGLDPVAVGCTSTCPLNPEARPALNLVHSAAA